MLGFFSPIFRVSVYSYIPFFVLSARVSPFQHIVRLLVYCLTFRLKIFRHHWRRRAEKFRSCTAPTTFDHGGIFIVSHLLWPETSILQAHSKVHLIECPCATSKGYRNITSLVYIHTLNNYLFNVINHLAEVELKVLQLSSTLQECRFTKVVGYREFIMKRTFYRFLLAWY